MYNEQQLEAAKSETFGGASLNDFIAKYQGGQNSPNLPVGDWEFKMTEEGELFVQTLESKTERQDGTKATYDVCFVYPKGNPEGTERRVYTSALVAPTAKTILYKDGKLKRSATFGVFSSNANGVRSTTVSTSVDSVNNGINAANAAYAKERAAKATAAEVGG